jgi:hypothetical protein
MTLGTIMILLAYCLGTLLGAVMVYRRQRHSESEVIAYTVECLIQNRFIRHYIDSDTSEPVLLEFDDDESERVAKKKQ